MRLSVWWNWQVQERTTIGVSLFAAAEEIQFGAQSCIIMIRMILFPATRVSFASREAGGKSQFDLHEIVVPISEMKTRLSSLRGAMWSSVPFGIDLRLLRNQISNHN